MVTSDGNDSVSRCHLGCHADNTNAESVVIFKNLTLKARGLMGFGHGITKPPLLLSATMLI